MKNFDISQVDVKLLGIFLAVFETGSVTAAADKLGLGQSLVSHALDRLRSAFNDPLFVRAGRSIAPTERARTLAPDIADITEKLVNLAEVGAFDPAALETTFSFSANDFERRLIAPTLLQEFSSQAPNAVLRFINTAGNVVEALRSRNCDVVVTPLDPPDVFDFHSEPLFSDSFACFFDDTELTADQVLQSYGSLEHAVVLYAGARTPLVENVLREHGVERNIRLMLPSFEALPDLLSGSKLVATLPSRLAGTVLANFGSVAFPYPSPTLGFQMIWHSTTQNSPKHRWFRSLVRETSDTLGKADANCAIG